MSDIMTAEVPFCVRDPFTGNNYADVVLQSGDGHTFHVMKVLLSMVSPVFKDMFSLPQAPTAPVRDAVPALPVVRISESGPVTDALLRYIYPADAPELLSVEFAFDVLLAAQKYDMDGALRGARRAIRELCSRDKNCVMQAFVLSYTHRLEDEIRLAASESLRFSPQDASFVDILGTLPAKAVLRLFLYHREVENNIIELFSHIYRLPTAIADAVDCYSCKKGTESSGRQSCRVPEWWLEIRRNISNGSRTMGPMSEEVFSRESLTEGVLSGCNSCKERLLRFGIDKFVDTVRAEMKKAALKVEFEIPWEVVSNKV